MWRGAYREQREEEDGEDGFNEEKEESDRTRDRLEVQSKWSGRGRRWGETVIMES